ncbi:hypothetical protein TWF694_005655 [Orbilia ellipsospora]|uniref:Rhodopsin domain-containing protein n=1 Tax=Orbilia ellipsospora TaxID=2528407 RepID=A0AAV9WSJ1_9PEZI
MASLAEIPGLPPGVVLPPLDLDSVNLLDTRRLTTQIYAITISMLVLVTSALVLRLYARFVFVGKLQLEDNLVIIGTVAALALSGLCLYSAAHLGLGMHVWLTDLDTLVDRSILQIKLLWAMVILYSASLTLAKCSVIVLYLKIFAGIRWFQKALYGILALIVLFFFLTFFTTIFQCHPIAAAFDFRIALTQHDKLRCLSIKDFFYVSGSVNMFTDLLLVVLPMPLAWKLGLDLRKRIPIILLFSLGILVTVASMVRITTLHSLGTFDLSYNTTGGLLWSIIEVNIALICASGPAIKPLILRFLPHMSDSFTHTISSKPSIREGPYIPDSPSNYVARGRGVSGMTFGSDVEAQRGVHGGLQEQSYDLETFYSQNEYENIHQLHTSHRSGSTAPSRTSIDTDSFSETAIPMQPKPLSPPPAIGRSQIITRIDHIDQSSI